MKLLIPEDFSFAKYHPGATDLPYEATAAKLRDEIVRRDASLDVHAPASAEETDGLIAEADALVCYSIGPERLARAGALRWIQAGSAGIDHFFRSSGISMADLQARGIRLTKAAGVTRIVIGEHVFAMLLALSRDIPRSVRQQGARVWHIHGGTELHGATLGIVGLGEIGGRIAELGKAFGMRVIGTRRRTAGYQGPADAVFGPDKVNDVLKCADYVVLSCSLNAQTRGLINADALRLMKPTAVLVNIARGEMVVEDDLVAALRDGTIAAAALDTFGAHGRGGGELSQLEALDADSELWSLPNVLITPNNASATPKIYDYLAEIVVDNAARLRAGQPLQHEVTAQD